MLYSYNNVFINETSFNRLYYDEWRIIITNIISMGLIVL